MNNRRSITSIELRPTSPVDTKCSWLDASWERADGTEGAAVVGLRRKKAESWHIARVLTEPALLRDVPVARIEAAVNADTTVRAALDAGDPTGIRHDARRAARQRPKLVRLGRSELDDDFFRLVADAYRGAVANGLHPGKTLADESDTPQGTVNRWIAEARRRGYLGPARPGKVSA